MKKTNKKAIFTALLSVVFVFALVFGISVKHPNSQSANADTVWMHDVYFENLTTQSTATEIYQASGAANDNGLNSIVETAPAYVEAPYQFFDNGYQTSVLYLNTNVANLSLTATDKTYRYNVKFQHYGLVNDSTLMI